MGGCHLKPILASKKKRISGNLYNGTESVKVETEVGCYQKYYSGIAKAINNEGFCPVSSEDSLNVIKILELAEESNRNRKTVTL